MNRALRIGLVGLSVVLVIGVGVVAWRGSRDADGAASSATPPKSNAELEREARAGTEPRPPRVRPTQDDLKKAGAQRREQSQRSIDELRKAAEAGDVAAQLEFGTRLAWCLGRDRDSVAAYRREQEHAKAVFAAHGESWPDDGLALDDESRQAMIDEENTALEQCALSDVVEIGNYHAWLERAARSGDVDAKVAYAKNALREFTGARPYDLGMVSDRRFADLPELIRRRDLARRWAEDAVRAGNTEILAAFSGQYGGGDNLGGLYPRDTLRWAIYDHAADLAYAWRNPSSEVSLEDHWENGPDRTDDLTDAQWDDAARQARELYLRWYGDPPG